VVDVLGEHITKLLSKGSTTLSLSLSEIESGTDRAKIGQPDKMVISMKALLDDNVFKVESDVVSLKKSNAVAATTELNDYCDGIRQYLKTQPNHAATQSEIGGRFLNRFPMKLPQLLTLSYLQTQRRQQSSH
jgi:hypothetical protein